MVLSNSYTVKYKYKLPDTTLVTDEKTSNTVKTEILSTTFEKILETNKNILNCGENAKIKVTLINNSTTIISDVNFKPSLTSNAIFVQKSVFVDGKNEPTFNLNTGFNLGDIQIGQTKIIEYEIQANEKPETTIQTFATLDYVANALPFKENTNTENILISVCKTLMISKSQNKSTINSGDTLTYTIKITNLTNNVKSNLIFKDILPSSATFVKGSLTENGEHLLNNSPDVPFTLKPINPKETTIIIFKVRIK